MSTATITANISVGGVAFTSIATRTAEGGVNHALTLAAGTAGKISATGVDNMTAGHGIAGAAVVDVHWTDPADGVTHKVRRGLTVDTTAAAAITFDETPAGEGDALPATGTSCVVSVQAVITTNWDGDLVEMIACKSTNRVCVDFRAAAASLKAITAPAGEAWSWVSNQGAANPLTGDPVESVVVSNGSATAATFNLGLLYDSV